MDCSPPQNTRSSTLLTILVRALAKHPPPLLPGGSIRLLRLMAPGEEDDRIHCQLLEFPLAEISQGIRCVRGSILRMGDPGKAADHFGRGIRPGCIFGITSSNVCC